MLTLLQALWAARDADFSFELIYKNHTLSTFDVLHQIHSIKLNVLLLTPSRLNVTTRHQTATTIQKFTAANKNSLGVIVYLLDARSSGNEQIEAVQSLGALHHCLSLGFTEPPPVLVVSDASYLLGQNGNCDIAVFPSSCTVLSYSVYLYYFVIFVLHEIMKHEVQYHVELWGVASEVQAKGVKLTFPTTF